MAKHRKSLFSAVIIIGFILLSAGCTNKPIIGEKVTTAPVTALVFEQFEEYGEIWEGVFYRRINDVEKLIASTDFVLIAFLDHNSPSSAAIPFLETLCDDFAGSLQIIRVNVEISHNSDDVNLLKTLFEVGGYPYFVLVSKGRRIQDFKGYDEDMKEKIISTVSEIISR